MFSAFDQLRNIICLGLSFFLLFLPFGTTLSFETTLNKRLGFLSNAALSGSFAVGSLFSASLVSWLGCRWSMIIGASPYVLYIAVNIHVQAVPVMIASVLVGMGSSLLWTAQGALLVQSSTDATLSRNSGIFWSLFQLAMVLGNLVTAFYVLYLSDDLRALFVSFTALSAVAVVSFMPLRENHVKNSRGEPSKEQLCLGFLATICEFRNADVLCLLPLILYIGISQSFFNGTLPPLLAATHGKHWLGIALALFASVEVLSGMVIAKLADHVGRRAVTFFAFLCASTSIAMTSLSERLWTWLVVFCLLAASDAVFQTMMCAYLGTFRSGTRSPIAFSYYKLVQSSSTAIAYLFSATLSFDIIRVVLFAILLLGILSLHFADRFIRSVEASSDRDVDVVVFVSQ